jgi:hypothetical protein
MIQIRAALVSHPELRPTIRREIECRAITHR